MSRIRYIELEETAMLEVASKTVYRKRWLVLAVYFFLCVVTSSHWVQYTIIGDVVARYYGVPDTSVDWTSFVFMVTITMLMVPACFVIDIMGMEWSLLLGGLLMMLGSWFKVTAVSPHRFPLMLTAQIAAAVGQVFTLATPHRLAALWFHSGELAFARAVAVLGTQLGLAIGMLVPPVVVGPHDDLSNVGRDLRKMTSIAAGYSTLATMLIVLLFKDRPRQPPSPTQPSQRACRGPVTLRAYLASLARLLTNRNYLLLLLSSGAASGALYAFITLLNPLVMLHFPNGHQLAGRVGLVIIAGGLLGYVTLSLLLDRTHKYKETALTVYTLMAVATGVFAVALRTEDPIVVYLSAGLLGVVLVGGMAVSGQLSAEVTHPESESTAANLLFVSASLLGAIMSAVCRELLRQHGDTTAVVFVASCLTAAAVVSALVRPDYRRLAAANLGDVGLQLQP